MPEEGVQVDFWDVGYGDATVIWLDTRRVVLVDAGPHNSRLPGWVKRNGLRVELAIFTHSHADHFDGFMNLMRSYGDKVRKYALHQDRPSAQLKKAWKELYDGRELHHWPDPINISPRRGCPQDLLAEAEITPPASLNSLRLEAIYPPVLNNVAAQSRGPNYAGAIIVMHFAGSPRVAWPGDLPLRICSDELVRGDVTPGFLVGPHHGGPPDVRDLTPEGVVDLIKAIGQTENWISVGWREDRQFPLPEYLDPLRNSGVTIRCSELTKRCDPAPDRFGRALFPSHAWLGLDPPRKGTSCMGPMRVRFYKDSYEVLLADEHRQARAQTQHPLCTRA